MDDDAREVLAREHASVSDRLADLESDLARLVAASADANADDEHDPEGSTIAFERAQLAALIEAARQHLAELDAGLARLADGRYGVCAVCGEPIPAERLAARPGTTTCVRCASASHR